MENKVKEIFDRFGMWISIGFAIAIFLSKIGLQGLNPLNVQWLRTSSSDWFPDLAAWMFYRNSDWTFPIGLFQGYSFPETVSIGLTGAIPLLAVPLKLIEGILPSEFQYFGFWLLACFILQAIFAYKLLSAVGIKSSIVRSLGACLFVLSYSMLDRIGHMNLCGHWLILAALYGYFQWTEQWKVLAYHALLVAMSVWVHPYLILFNLVIGGAHFLNMFMKKDLALWKVPVFSLVLVLAASAAWMLLGNHYLDTDQAVAEGFGIYSANLNTFVTPKIDTPLMSAQKRVYEGQFEGTAYLGLGILSMLFFIPYMIIGKKVKLSWNRNYNVILVVALALFIYALSHRVTLNQHVILELKLPELVMEYLSIFRASGRYVWLLQYLFISAFILIISQLEIAIKWRALILLLAIGINSVDFYDVLKRNKYIASYHPSIEHFDDKMWGDIICDAEQFRMYPAYQQGYNKYGDQMEFAFIAGKCGQNINAGHLARFNSHLRTEYSLSLRDSIIRTSTFGAMNNYTLLTTVDHIADFTELVKYKRHELFEINGYYILIPKNRLELISRLKGVGEKENKQISKEGFGAFAQRNSGNTLLMAVKDEASKELINCESIQNWINEYESELVNLEYRESFGGIFGGSQIIVEQRGKSSPNPATVRIDTLLTFLENGNKHEKTIEIFSAGNENGNKASIFVEGIDYSKNDRGLNIVVLDPSGQVVESTSFDTYESCHHFSKQSKLFFELWKIN